MVRRKDDAVIVGGKKNPFAALESDTEDEMESGSNAPSPIQPAPTLHTPITPVIKEERKSYASAVTRGTTKGWVSIKWQGPQFVDDDDELSEKEIVKEALEEAGVIGTEETDDVLKESSQMTNAEPTNTQSTNTQSTNAQPPDLKPLWNRSTNTAAVWAERVKHTLEKAESERKPHTGPFKPTEDFVGGIGRLSFFRKEQ